MEHMPGVIGRKISPLRLNRLWTSMGKAFEVE